MNKLFLKIAIRYLFKNKLYSFINIFGLAFGVFTFLAILIASMGLFGLTSIR